MHQAKGQLGIPEFIMVVSLSTILLQWVTIIEVGLKVKPVHLSLFLSFGYFLISNEYRNIIFDFIRQKFLFVLCYSLFLLIAAISIYYSPLSIVEGFIRLFKYFTYFLFFILYTGIIIQIMRRETQRIVFIGIIVGLVSFFLYAYLVFSSMGRNFVFEYVATFFAGDASKLRYDFYLNLFNYDGKTLSRSDAEAIAVNLRNSMVGAFSLFLVLTLAVKVQSNAIKFIKRVIIPICVFMIISSVSRSNMLILALVFVYAYYLKVQIEGLSFKIKPIKLIIVGLISITVAFFSYQLILLFTPVVNMISERLGQISEDARISIFFQALQDINANWFFGHGFDARVTLFKKEIDNHNFILGSWYQFGIFGLLVSLFFYFFFFVDQVILVKNYINKHISFTEVEFVWIMTLIISPLFRTLVSGDNGSLSLVDWFFFSFYFGLTSIGQPRKV